MNQAEHHLHETSSANGAADDSHPVEKESVASDSTNPQLSPQELFDVLYADHPHKVAREVSRHERTTYGYVSLSLVYGEIAFEPFRLVLEQLKRTNLALTKPGGVFLDIGSGSGKAVFAAALCHDFDACAGIEILDGLYEISLDVLAKWERTIKRQYELSLVKKRTRITFTQGDALEWDWSSLVAGAASADLVFMNSTCFSANLLKELTRKLAVYCKPGAVVICATHALPDTQSFEHLRTMRVAQEAWGEATWYVHRKK